MLNGICEGCGRATGRRRFCKACRSRENRENKPLTARIYTGRETPEFKAKQQERYVANSTASKELIKAAKGRPCIDCGGSFPAICMDFDHIAERGPKLFNISDIAGRKPATVGAELAKCDVICSNCHRTRTRIRVEFAGGRGMVAVTPSPPRPRPAVAPDPWCQLEFAL